MTLPTSPASAMSLSELRGPGDDQAQNECIVGAYNTLIEAELARGRLDVEGITSRLVDGNTISVAAPLAQALGGVKLVIATDDLEAARAALGSAADLAADLADDGDDDAPQALQTAAGDAQAQRAFRAAVLGLVVLPVIGQALSVMHLVELRRRGARCRRRGAAASGPPSASTRSLPWPPPSSSARFCSEAFSAPGR
jgi:hypothetical protein